MYQDPPLLPLVRHDQPGRRLRVGKTMHTQCLLVAFACALGGFALRGQLGLLDPALALGLLREPLRLPGLPLGGFTLGL